MTNRRRDSIDVVAHLFIRLGRSFWITCLAPQVTLSIYTKHKVVPISQGIIHQQEIDTMAAKRVPDGYHRVTPHLVVRNAAGLIDFYKKAFGGVEKRRAPGADGKSIMHAELQIGDSIVFV